MTVSLNVTVFYRVGFICIYYTVVFYQKHMTVHLIVTIFYQNNFIEMHLGTIFFLICPIFFRLYPAKYNYFMSNGNLVNFKRPVLLFER